MAFLKNVEMTRTPSRAPKAALPKAALHKAPKKKSILAAALFDVEKERESLSTIKRNFFTSESTVVLSDDVFIDGINIDIEKIKFDSEVAFVPAKLDNKNLSIALRVDPQIDLCSINSWGVFCFAVACHQKSFKAIVESLLADCQIQGYDCADQTVRMKDGHVVLKMPCDETFGKFFSEELTELMNGAISPTRFVDTIKNLTDLVVTVNVGLYVNNEKKKIGIYTTLQKISI